MAATTAVVAGTVAASAYSANKSAKASKSAANAQSEASQGGVDEQRRQFDKMTELLNPYSLAATGSVGGDFDADQYLRENPDVAANPTFANDPLRHYNLHGKAEGRPFPTTKASSGSLSAQRDLLGLNGQGAQAAAYGQIENSPIFAGLVKQGEAGILQNASATGGLRGGNTQGALAQFRPQLLNQLVQQQYQNLGGLTALGQNSAAQQGNAGMQSANNIGNLLAQGGAAQAGGIIGQANAQNQLVSNLVGIGGAAYGAGAF